MDKNQFNRALRVIAGIIERAPHVSGCPGGRSCSCGASDSRHNLVHIAHALDLDWAGPPENVQPDYCQSCKNTPTLPGADGLLICEHCRETIPTLLLKVLAWSSGFVPGRRSVEFSVTLETGGEITAALASLDGAAFGWIRLTEKSSAATPPVIELRLSSIVAVTERVSV